MAQRSDKKDQPPKKPARGSTVGRLGMSAGRLVMRPTRAVAGDMLEPVAEAAVDRALAGPLPEAIARSLVEHHVIERVVREVLASADFDAAVDAALQGRRRRGPRRAGAGEPPDGAHPRRGDREQADRAARRPDAEEPRVRGDPEADDVEPGRARRDRGADDDDRRRDDRVGPGDRDRPRHEARARPEAPVPAQAARPGRGRAARPRPTAGSRPAESL